jgi:hypothetical protein
VSLSAASATHRQAAHLLLPRKQANTKSLPEQLLIR